MRRCVHRFFRIPIEQISYVRFIVESYEGLAQVTSLPGRGEIEWIIPEELEPQAQGLIDALCDEAQMVPIGRPRDWPPPS